MSGAIYLRVDGEVRGQGRPRITTRGGRPRAFTDQATRSAAARIQNEWIAAGRPKLQAGPYRAEVRAFLRRPAGHYRTGGALSAAGRRAAHPTRKPDSSNIGKLVEDALVAVGALPDDAACVDLHVTKAWALPGHEGLEVYATSLVSAVAA